MANIKSAKKRVITSQVRAERNKAIKSRVKTYIKKVEAILKSVEKDLATLLIVSQATLIEGVAGGAEATGREDLKVSVLPPDAP